MRPVIFQTTLFGILSEPWSLHSYGVLIAAGFLVAMLLAMRRAKREGEDPDRIVDLAFWLLVIGLVGARALFIVTKWDEYLHDPLRILKFWYGGHVWYGGFVAAALFLVYYCKKHRLSTWKLADVIVPSVALAHAFGRVGCFAAGCCFGAPTHAALGVIFPIDSMANQAQQQQGLVDIGEAPLPVHPTQLYEAGLELGLFALLMALARRRRFEGQLTLTWMVLYSVGRFLIELARGDEVRGVYFGISTSQYVSMAVLAVAAGLYVRLRRQRRARVAPVVAA